MSGGKGGSTTSQVEIPAWLEDAAKTNLARADQLSTIGYTPYYGADVAALTPMQQASMQNTNQGASAFGMAAPTDAMAGMPQAQTFAGGVQGYSSGGLYDQALSELQTRRPGQFAALNAPFINPYTGAPPASPFGGSLLTPNNQADANVTPPRVPRENNSDIIPRGVTPPRAPREPRENNSDIIPRGVTPPRAPREPRENNSDIIPRKVTQPVQPPVPPKVTQPVQPPVPPKVTKPVQKRVPRENNSDIVARGDKLICTAMNKMGLLPDDIYALDAEFGLKVNREDRMLGDGYRLWALPVSEYIKRDTIGAKALRTFMLPITLAWAKEMAHKMRPEEYKTNYAGKVIMAIGHPICRAIGYAFIGGLAKKDA